MKSVKPGRGPSMMSGAASVAVAIFGLIWTAGAASIGAPGVMVLFGVVFIVIAIIQGIYAFSNATRKNRFSTWDITDTDEEPDPLNERFGEQKNAAAPDDGQTPAAYCPYCGAPVPEEDHLYCGRCGRKLPPA